MATPIGVWKIESWIPVSREQLLDHGLVEPTDEERRETLTWRGELHRVTCPCEHSDTYPRKRCPQQTPRYGEG